MLGSYLLGSYNSNLPEIGSKSNTEIVSETHQKDVKTQVRFHCKVNGLTSEWLDFKHDSDKTDPKQCINHLAAEQLHCREKDVFFRTANINHTLNHWDETHFNGADDEDK